MWMAALGPKLTGSDAHSAFVDFLARELQTLGLEVARDPYVFTRWEAQYAALEVGTNVDGPHNVPVTSVYPYSGQTEPTGTRGTLVYGGRADAIDVPPDLTGKIVYFDAPTPTSTFSFAADYEFLGKWGSHSAVPRAARGDVIASLSAEWPPTLVRFKQAGALGAVFGWTDVPEPKAEFQYVPWSRVLQGLPSVWVGPHAAAQLRQAARGGAPATLTLKATLTPDCRADMLTAVLPGTSSEELIIVNTHTDGTNAVEENGGLALLALARYFSALPKRARRRTLVFAFAAGHFARPYVPSMNGFVERYPEMVRHAVASVTIEHLGCREWKQDERLVFRATGQDELSIVVTNTNAAASIVGTAVSGTSDRRGVVLKAKSGMGGEGRFLAAAGVPTIAWLPAPEYLVSAPPNGYIERVSRRLMYGQVQAFTRMLHIVDGLSPAELKG
ncbi:MAG TPA: hypothetical protein VM166_11520 [Gemmatimonadaceae bacterium]|nr:hypothetical protein [Gemmatimonadaceae bacterium]